MLLEGEHNSARPEILDREGGVQCLAIFQHMLERVTRMLDIAGRMERVSEPQDWLRRELAALIVPIVSFEIREMGHFRIAIESAKQWARPIEFFRDPQGLVRRLPEELILDRHALCQVLERIEHLFEMRLGSNPSAVIQQSMVDILGQMAPRLAQAGFLGKPAESSHPAVRASAFRALAKIGIASEDYLPGRAQHPLGGKIFSARQEALAILAARLESSGDPDEITNQILPALASFQWTAVPHLARFLDSDGLDQAVLIALVRLLGSLRDAARPASAKLGELLHHPAIEVKLEACFALMSIGVAEAGLQKEIFALADSAEGASLRELLDTGWYGGER